MHHSYWDNYDPCIYIMPFSTLFIHLFIYFVIFRKSHYFWQEIIPGRLYSPLSCLRHHSHPWYNYCLTGFTVLMSIPLCIQHYPANGSLPFYGFNKHFSVRSSLKQITDLIFNYYMWVFFLPNSGISPVFLYLPALLDWGKILLIYHSFHESNGQCFQ